MKPLFQNICALLAMLLAPLAHAQEQVGDEQKAIGLVQRAEDYCDTGRNKEAEPVLKEAQGLKADYPPLYHAWGCIYERQGEWKKAEEKYKKWSELDPENYKPFEMLGKMADRQRRYSDSNDYFTAARRLNPYRTFIADSICNNFVQMRKWKEAVKACTDAIALDPGEGYAYGERSRAELALGENDKANADADAAGSFHRDFGRTKFLTSTMFPFLFAVISITFLGSGLAVLFRRKPLLFSARWVFVLMVVCFAPQLVLPVTMPDIPGGTLEGLKVINWLLPLMFLVLLAFLWVQMQGYIVFGIVDKSFRKALFSVLDVLHLESQEQLSFLRIPSADLDIQVAIQAWTGVGQIKNKNKTGQEVFSRIIDGLKQRFAAGELETNNTTPVLYIVLGIFMLIFSYFFMKDF